MGNESAIPLRFQWAASIINVQPGDRILEIGCGAGLLADQLAGSVSKISITAIDRSAAMIAKACKRNARHIEDGTMTLLVADVSGLRFIPGCFNKIVAFNVDLFRGKYSETLEVVNNALCDGGQLFLFHQGPPGRVSDWGELIKKSLEKSNFIIEQKLEQFVEPAMVYGFVSRPVSQA